MPEEVLFKSESDQSREEIASYLRKVAENLDSGNAVTLKAGTESVTLNPPARPTFEVKAEREGPAGNMTERSIEFELEWDENDGDTAAAAYTARISQTIIGPRSVDADSIATDQWCPLSGRAAEHGR